MPLYEYKCKKCGKTVEKIQKFSDAPLTTCEFCGGELERLLSSPAIQFKGSGWYVTDYARKSTPAAGASGGDAPAATDKKEGKKDSTTTSEPAKTSKE